MGIRLENESQTCIYVTTKYVDFWIISANLSKRNTLWNTTTGVGVRVDALLVGRKGRVNFPAAAAIDVKELPGSIICAPLKLHVLDHYDLWESDPNSATQTTSINFPLYFVRTKVISDTAKIAKALIDFTTSAATTVPPNPYSEAAEMVGRFANSIFSVLQSDPKEVSDPPFLLNFGLSQSSSDCKDMELKEGKTRAIA
jgi:hypothetical protein